MSIFNDADERVPILEFGNDGKMRNVRPTIYHREAVEAMNKYGPQGIIGYIVENQFGDCKPMTFKQFSRMRGLFESKQLKVKDYWRVHTVAQEMALTGFDTEMTGAGFNQFAN